MLFNSLDFAIFLPLVFILYWGLCRKSKRHQNLLILVASYVFYGWWDWRFLSLLLISTVVDYTVGLQLKKTNRANHRKLLLFISLAVNLGLLGFFKYYNFFIENFTTAFTFFGGSIQPNTLNIILPVGISFYTFQTLSYTIDIYRKKLKPTSDFVSFATFVSFFPQLVAGPIERATQLLPQFSEKRRFNANNAVTGIKQVIWGLFKKIVIADSCAQYANEIFATYETASSSTLILGVVYFAFQIYGDFSGYSDIAIGTARLFNIKLLPNFRYPYFSRDIAEFWRRWHISLSTWFRDYIYIPLGGSRGSKAQHMVNLFVVFSIGGLWHGANWNFIVWGVLNALFFIPLVFYKKYSVHKDTVAQHTVLPSLKEGVQMLSTFMVVLVGWVFFRSETLSQALGYLKGIFNFDFHFELLNIGRYTVEMLPLLIILISIEWFCRKQEFPLCSPRYEYIKTIGIVIMILVFGSFSTLQDFIYFQF